MITFQNFHGDPTTWTICGTCAADLPEALRYVGAPPGTGPRRGAWVKIGSRIVSIVCSECEALAVAGRNVGSK